MLSTQFDERIESCPCHPFAFPVWMHLDVIELAWKSLYASHMDSIDENIVSQHRLSKRDILRIDVIDIVCPTHI